MKPYSNSGTSNRLTIGCLLYKLFVCFFNKDPAVQTFSGATAVTYQEDVATTVTITSDVKNIASAGNNVVGVTGSDANFKFEAVLSDVDLAAGGTDTLSIAAIPLTVLPSTMAQQRLDAQATLSFTMTASVTIAAAKCPNVEYFCIRLSEGSGATYTDPQTSNNIMCVIIESVKYCASGKAF